MMRVICCILLMLFFCGTLHAATIYVDNTLPGDCSDNDSDYDPAENAGAGGCAAGSNVIRDTIQEGIASANSAGGDTIYIRSGTYTGGILIVDLTVLNINNTSWTNIWGYPTDTRPVLDCNDSSQKGIYSGDTTEGATNDRAIDYIHIKYLEIKDCTEFGIYFYIQNDDGSNCADSNCVGSDYITIEDVKVHGCVHAGINITGGHEDVNSPNDGESHDILITKSEVYNNTGGDHGIKLTSMAGPGVTDHSHIYDVVVSECKVYSNTGSSGIKSSNGSYNITFRHNLVYGNGDSGLYFDGTWNSTMYGNVVYENAVTAGSSEIWVTTSTSTGNTFFNNTIVSTAGAICTVNDNCSVFWSETAVDEFKNNIAYVVGSGGSGGSAFVMIAKTQSADDYNYNQYYAPNVTTNGWSYNSNDYTFANWQSIANQGTNSDNADPLFTDIGTDDYTLQPGSPAISNGSDLGSGLSYCIDPTSTWPNNVIPVDCDSFGASGWPIGAFEHEDEETISHSGVSIN